MSTTIFVFGAPGVGKTTACKSYVRRHPSFHYISASEVLRKVSGSSREALRRADAPEVLQNQEVLARALASQISGSQKKHFLIDSQNVIDNDFELVEVPSDIVRSLGPSGIILLEASAEEVHFRRSRDVRSRPVRTVDQIEIHLEKTRSLTVDYAAKLGVPMLTGLVTEGFVLDELIDKLLETGN